MDILNLLPHLQLINNLIPNLYLLFFLYFLLDEGIRMRALLHDLISPICLILYYLLSAILAFLIAHLLINKYYYNYVFDDRLTNIYFLILWSVFS